MLYYQEHIADDYDDNDDDDLVDGMDPMDAVKERQLREKEDYDRQ